MFSKNSHKIIIKQYGITNKKAIKETNYPKINKGNKATKILFYNFVGKKYVYFLYTFVL